MGLLASLELRSRNLAPSLLAAIDASNSSRFSELVVYGFVDAARVSLQGAEVGQQRRTPLLGSGLGLRLGVRPGISLALDWAQRHRPVPGHPDADSQHVHLRAALRF
jgi:hemolysin activation/secretion protein